MYMQFLKSLETILENENKLVIEESLRISVTEGGSKDGLPGCSTV